MLDEVKRLAGLQDHRARVREAADLLTKLQASVVETARIRRESITWLRGNGYSMADVAELMGVSRARVAQLKDAGPPPERAFLGVGAVRVAVPERAGGRRLVARADSAAGQRVLSLAHRLGLDGELEYIPVSGDIDLNRDNLVVICGPKSSPVTAKALAADPHLSFEELPDGRWVMIERASGRHFTSPSDEPGAPRSADVAYLGRLPRPDRAGSFLYVAGVHSIGSLGAVTYLSEHLPQLYDELGNETFSMVVASEYDEATEEILSTTALTQPLRQAG
jgi:hypothetical protein